MKEISLILLLAGICLSAAGLEDDLFSAVDTGVTYRVKEMLIAGADVNARNQQDDTPLSLAIRKKFCEIIFLLVKHGATDPVCRYNRDRIEHKQEIDRGDCLKFQLDLLDALEMYLVDNGAQAIAGSVAVDDLESSLSPYLKDRKFPRCPAGGKYYFYPKEDSLLCTFHGIHSRFINEEY
ncbi:MAG: hypothetical protein PHW04_00130 [Candidatus Wallbacteria bacterium]|nr:hypothetical protein [Candidatus Wallbacteria bacterium]